MDKKEVSGEDYKAMLINNSKAKTNSKKLAILLVVIIVLCGLSFYGGTAYQKTKNSLSNSASNNQTSGLGRGFGARLGIVFGQVTAVSSSSISIKNSRTGSTSTLAITSNTTVTNNGQSASVGDIQVGDTVLVRKNSSSTSQASQISINPSFGGMGGGTGGTGTSTNSTPNSSI